MASAVPLVLRILRSEDASIRVEPLTGEPVALVVDTRVDPALHKALLDVVAALDMARRIEEAPPHAPSNEADR